MARAGRSAQAMPSRSGGGFMLGVFVGLLVGLLVAAAIALYVNRAPTPFVTRSPAASKEAPGSPGAAAPSIAGMPKAPSGNDKAGEKPRFDFYRILPGGEEAVSERELAERSAAAAKGVPETAKERYVLQAGAFQSPADADNQKAKLALLGLESNVEPAQVPDKGTVYRVRLGPYSRIDEINRMRQTLAQNGIEASLVRIREAEPGKAN